MQAYKPGANESMLVKKAERERSTDSIRVVKEDVQL